MPCLVPHPRIRTERTTTTVLIADDEPGIRDILSLVLVDGGYDVVGQAANGQEAVDLAREHRPDYVILDYMMPRLDGSRAAAIVREVSPSTVIVAFSAVLRNKPEWGDVFLSKEKVSSVASFLDALSHRAEATQSDDVR